MPSAFSALRRARPHSPAPVQPEPAAAAATPPLTVHCELVNGAADAPACSMTLLAATGSVTTLRLDSMTLAAAVQDSGAGSQTRAVSLVLRLEVEPGYRVLGVELAGTLSGALLGAAGKGRQPLTAGLRAANFASIEASIHSADQGQLDERHRWYQGQIAKDRTFSFSVQNVRERAQLVVRLRADMYVEAGPAPSYASLQLLQPVLTIRTQPTTSSRGTLGRRTAALRNRH